MMTKNTNRDDLMKMAKYYELKNFSNLSSKELENKINTYLEKRFSLNWNTEYKTEEIKSLLFLYFLINMKI